MAYPAGNTQAEAVGGCEETGAGAVCTVKRYSLIGAWSGVGERRELLRFYTQNKSILSVRAQDSRDFNPFIYEALSILKT